MKRNKIIGIVLCLLMLVLPIATVTAEPIDYGEKENYFFCDYVTITGNSDVIGINRVYYDFLFVIKFNIIENGSYIIYEKFGNYWKFTGNYSCYVLLFNGLVWCEKDGYLEVRGKAVFCKITKI